MERGKKLKRIGKFKKGMPREEIRKDTGRAQKIQEGKGRNEKGHRKNTEKKRG
jgi:hypothetical protein